MTVSTQTAAVTVLGNGSTTVFNFPWQMPAVSGYILVLYNNGSTTVALNPTTYSISFNAAPAGQLWGTGGTVTYTINGSPITTGTSLTIIRIDPLQQTTGINNQGTIYANTIEQALDLLEFQIQQVANRTGLFRGTWQTATQYNYGDIVVDGVNGNNTGNYYFCSQANTSGLWSSDLSNGDWQLFINIQNIIAQVVAQVSNVIGGGIWSANYTTLAAADAAAVAAGVPLNLNSSFTLAANTTLNANYIAAGGIITMNGFNLTFNGSLNGPDIQMVNVGAWGAAGTLNILSGSLIKGVWLTGAYGQNIDYSPGIQQAINIIMRTSSIISGPRVLDLSRGATTLAGYGIEIQHSISFPTGAAPGGGAIWAHGQLFMVNISGANSPVFIVGSAILWSFKADGWASFEWNTSNLPTSSNTNAVVFQFTEGSSGNGSSQFTIDGVFVYQGYGFCNTAGAGYSGWWASTMQNIQCNNCVGSMIYCNQAAGNNERQYYRNLNFTGNQTGGTIPAIFLSTSQAEIHGLSIDGYGSGTQGAATSAAVQIGGGQFKISSVHFESCVWGGAGNCFGIYVNGNTTPGNIGATCSIDQLTIAGTTSIAANTTLYAIFSFQGASISADNINVFPITLGSGAIENAFGCDVNSFISVGRNVFYHTSGVSGWNPYATLTTYSPPSSITQTGEKNLVFYTNTLATTAAETDMSITGSSINGLNADRNYYYQGLSFELSAALTAGTITLKTYSASTLIDTRTITSTNGASGFLQFQSGIYNSSFLYSANKPIRVTITSASLDATKNIQVSLRIV